MSAFVIAAAMAAVLTMATALSVTDFLQLIFPSDAGGGTSLKTAGSGNPVMLVLGRVSVPCGSGYAKGAAALRIAAPVAVWA